MLLESDHTDAVLAFPHRFADSRLTTSSSLSSSIYSNISFYIVFFLLFIFHSSLTLLSILQAFFIHQLSFILFSPTGTPAVLLQERASVPSELHRGQGEPPPTPPSH